MRKEKFIEAGFKVASGEDIPQLEDIEKLQEYIRRNNLDTPENLANLIHLLKILVVDEKVNGYGLNFVGRNFARAKYAQKTDKEVRLNTAMSKNIDTTQNLVLKGDNLDSLKILKSHYSGKIKCIYIDPPYNTTSDEFVYPDKFDKEEAEVLGLANLSESDFARMEFSFKTKKSHNGWLAFMYPRLLLARDLLTQDGVIFISIDDNEQANLKLLCDDVFGEENFVGQFIINSSPSAIDYGHIGNTHEYAIFYAKNSIFAETSLLEEEEKVFKYTDSKGGFNLYPLYNGNVAFNPETRPNLFYPFYLNPQNVDDNGFYEISIDKKENFVEVYPVISKKDHIQRVWRWGKIKARENLNDEIVGYKTEDGEYRIVQKTRLTGKIIRSLQIDSEISSRKGTAEIQELFERKVFTFPKPVELIRRFLAISTEKKSIILDFFAGSGTTGHAVMQLNAEDGGNRKFILCQIDEPIDPVKKKEAYKFCTDNNLPPVISSITIERLKRAGEKIRITNEELRIKKSEELDFNPPNPDDPANPGPDIGFKVFDCVEAPKLELEDGDIVFPEIHSDALSRIYSMIFNVGLDEPTQVPEEVVKDCIYKVGTNYYITNSEKVSRDDLANAVKDGKVFIDGWTASLNGTLQAYKDDVKIVF